MKPKRENPTQQNNSDMKQANLYCYYTLILPVVFVLSGIASYLLSGTILNTRQWGMEGFALFPVILIAVVISAVLGVVISVYVSRKQSIFYLLSPFLGFGIVAICNACFYLLILVITS